MLRLMGKRTVLSFVLLAAVAAPGLCVKPDPPQPAGGGGIAQANAHVYGMSLQDWLKAYWAWNYSVGGPTAPYQPGPAPVVFLPLPAGTQTGGDFSADNPVVMVGSIDITLPTGTGFVLPFFAWVAERYHDIPPSRMIPSSKRT
jgi:hypothetical protein